jgi:hypothetical protein
VGHIRTQITPPVCNGRDSLESYRFLKKYEIASTANAWNEEIKIAQFPHYLSGLALQWFLAYDSLRIEVNRIDSWTELRGEFLIEVCNQKELEEQATFLLYALVKDSNEKLCSYFHRGIEIRNRLIEDIYTKKMKRYKN